MACNWQGDNNPGHARRLSLWQAIEDEFDEPLADVIAGLREQGNTWRTVAGALGVSLSVLVEWRKALGLPLNQREQTYDPSSPAQPNKSDINACALGYNDASSAIADMRLKGMTLKEIGEKLNIHPVHVCKLSPPPIKGIHNTSARGAAVHREQVKHRKRGGREHIWSKDNDILFANAKAKV